jgi:2-keto-4-pentenoate hydratase
MDELHIGVPQLIADNACAHRLILGQAATRPCSHIDLAAHAVSAEVTGNSMHEGKGANVLGYLRAALA